MGVLKKIVVTTGKVAATVVVGGFGLLTKSASDALSRNGIKTSSSEYRGVSKKCFDVVHRMWGSNVSQEDLADLKKSANKATDALAKDRAWFNNQNYSNMKKALLNRDAMQTLLREKGLPVDLVDNKEYMDELRQQFYEKYGEWI